MVGVVRVVVVVVITVAVAVTIAVVTDEEGTELGEVRDPARAEESREDKPVE